MLRTILNILKVLLQQIRTITKKEQEYKLRIVSKQNGSLHLTARKNKQTNKKHTLLNKTATEQTHLNNLK